MISLTSDMKSKKYFINEWFYSLQGEGLRAGCPSIFLRFGKCNLQCHQKEQGFDCDTEFESGNLWSLDEIVSEIKKIAEDCRWIVFTGGEPSLQLDDTFIDRFHAEGFKLAIETNGTLAISSKIDWICVSPKTSEHSIKQKKAHEVKYVRSYGMGIPKTSVSADHYLISPAFEADHLPQKNLDWCIQLVKQHPEWRLSLQTHKWLKMR